MSTLNKVLNFDLQKESARKLNCVAWLPMVYIFNVSSNNAFMTHSRYLCLPSFFVKWHRRYWQACLGNHLNQLLLPTQWRIQLSGAEWSTADTQLSTQLSRCAAAVAAGARVAVRCAPGQISLLHSTVLPHQDSKSRPVHTGPQPPWQSSIPCITGEGRLASDASRFIGGCQLLGDTYTSRLTWIFQTNITLNFTENLQSTLV